MEIGKIYGYVRISKDTSDMENQRYQIDLHSKTVYGRKVDEWFEDLITGKAKATERELGKLIDKTKKKDVLLMASTSRFGRNFFDVMLTGSILYEKGAGLYAIQQNFDFSPRNPMAKIFLSIYAFMDEAERENISSRTKAALQRLKAEGVKLGKPLGSYTKKLEGKESEIKNYIEKGLSKTAIGKIYGVKRQTITSFIKNKSAA